MKESTIEARLRKAVERAGGRCLKWVSPGHTGVPDRIILMPGGRVYFAETKAPGEKERARQEYVQRKLRALGFKVFSSVDTFERVGEVLQELTEDQKPARWICIRDVDGDPAYLQCGHCGRRIIMTRSNPKYSFCPKCGKPMRGKEEPE